MHDKKIVSFKLANNGENPVSMWNYAIYPKTHKN